MEARGGSEVFEWNGFQWIDSIEKKYPNCGDITSDIDDTLKEFEACPLVSSGNFLSNECVRDTHGEMCLGNSSVGPLLG
jgi:hypothetical protein